MTHFQYNTNNFSTEINSYSKLPRYSAYLEPSDPHNNIGLFSIVMTSEGECVVCFLLEEVMRGNIEMRGERHWWLLGAKWKDTSVMSCSGAKYVGNASTVLCFPPLGELIFSMALGTFCRLRFTKFRYIRPWHVFASSWWTVRRKKEKCWFFFMKQNVFNLKNFLRNNA